METESETRATYIGDCNWCMLFNGERFCARVPYGCNPEQYLTDIYNNSNKGE